MSMQEQIARVTETVSIPTAGVAWLGQHLGMVSTTVAIAVGLGTLVSIFYSIRLKRKQIAKT